MAQPDSETLSKALQEIEQVIQSSQISSKLFGTCLYPRMYTILTNGKGEGHSASRAMRHLQIHLLNSSNSAAQIFTALLEASGVAPNSATLHRRVVVQAIDVENVPLAETKAEETSKLLDIQHTIQSYFGRNVLTRGIALDFPQATDEQVKTKTPPIMFNLSVEAFIKTGFLSIQNYEADLKEANVPYESFDHAIALKRSDTYDVKGIGAYYLGLKIKDIKKEHATILMTECQWDLVFAVTLSKAVYNASLFLSGVLDQAVFHRHYDDEKVVLHISFVGLALLHNLFSEARSLPFFAVDAASTVDNLVVHSSIKDTTGKINQLKAERDARLAKIGEESEKDEEISSQQVLSSKNPLPTVADADFSQDQLKEYLKTSQGLSDEEVNVVCSANATA